MGNLTALAVKKAKLGDKLGSANRSGCDAEILRVRFFPSTIHCRGMQDVAPMQNCASLYAEARLQQIDLSDELAGCYVRELARPRHAVELGPFGAESDKPELPLDLVDLAS